MIWRQGEGDPYALLNTLLVEAGGVEPPSVLARTPRGKPYFPEYPHLQFSVSHSGGLALCALGEKPLGADIEVVWPRSPGLPRYALGEEEYRWFTARGSRWEDFYTLWTLKEARVKCTGEGLSSAAVRDIRVPLLKPGETGELEGFRFTALSGEGWRGAICEEIS